MLARLKPLAPYACLTSAQLRAFPSAAPAPSGSNSSRRAQSSAPIRGTMVQRGGERGEERESEGSPSLRRSPLPKCYQKRRRSVRIAANPTARIRSRASVQRPPLANCTARQVPSRRPHPRGGGGRRGEEPPAAGRQSFRSRLHTPEEPARPRRRRPSASPAAGPGSLESPSGSGCHRSPPPLERSRRADGAAGGGDDGG